MTYHAWSFILTNDAFPFVEASGFPHGGLRITNFEDDSVPGPQMFFFKTNILTICNPRWGGPTNKLGNLDICQLLSSWSKVLWNPSRLTCTSASSGYPQIEASTGKPVASLVVETGLASGFWLEPWAYNVRYRNNIYLIIFEWYMVQIGVVITMILVVMWCDVMWCDVGW